MAEKPKIIKTGTLYCDLVEATPVVFKNSLYRFEYVRDSDYRPNSAGPSCFRFVDMTNNEASPPFAHNFHLGSAFVDEDTAWAFGVNRWGQDEIHVFWSRDLVIWQSAVALHLPGWGLYNTSVCRGPRGYVMAFECGEPPEEVGHRFTNRFAVSDDLVNWRVLPGECVFARDRYTACPVLRHLDDGYYYMIYLEMRPGPSFVSYITRTRDFITWQPSPLNPFMISSDADRLLAHDNFTPEERIRIAEAVNINNSDVDLCEFRGRTHIVYSWGNQKGVEHLAGAVYEGSMAQLLQGFFPSAHR